MGMHPVSSQENSLTKGELVLILKKKNFFCHFLTQYNFLLKKKPPKHLKITGDTFYLKHFIDKSL